MVRNRKKIALYEVISRAGTKTNYHKTVEELHHKSPEQETAEHQDNIAEGPSEVVRWVRKPSIVQFNAGRFEFSLPYQVVIAAGLILLLLMVIVYRIGERAGSGQAANAVAAVETPVMETIAQEPIVAEPAPIEQAASTGNNRIVIQMYQVRAHLEPAKVYFDSMGVATEIIQSNNWYYLVTKNKYDNPEKQGTDGYEAKQKIIKIGAGYKAPAGYETFGTQPFHDAFGMRFE